DELCVRAEDVPQRALDLRGGVIAFAQPSDGQFDQPAERGNVSGCREPQPEHAGRTPGQVRRKDRSSSRSSASVWRSAPFLVVPILPETVRPVGRCVTVIQTIRWPDRNDFPPPDATSKSAWFSPHSANTSGRAGWSSVCFLARFFGRRSPTLTPST